MPLWMLLIVHILVLGIALLAYAYPHHVVAREKQATGTVTTRTLSSHSQTIAPTHAPTPAPAATAEPLSLDSATDAPSEAPTEAPTPAPTDAVGSFKIKFADHFTDGEVIRGENSYRSANIDATFTETYSKQHKLRFYVIDFYISDITCFGTVLAQDTFGKGYVEWPKDAGVRTGSIATMSGDYYGARDTGVVVRNGVLYECTRSPRDVCVVYWDGVMKTFTPDEFDARKEIEENGAYHAWNFGPQLLDDNGEPLKNFNPNYPYQSNYPHVTERAPRAAVGYVEPGHYIFIVVDGRTKETVGVSLPELAILMNKLGCKQAFNLDGGGTAMICWGDRLLNKPLNGGRKSSDFIVLREPEKT